MTPSSHTVAPAAGPLVGTARVPGDKSISHRAVLFAAMAQGTSHLVGVLDSADVRSTIDAIRTLGASAAVTECHPEGLDLDVTGWGEAGPKEAVAPIYCGNSGTTVRLLLGVLAGWPGRRFTLSGDKSLSTRPMARVTGPLTVMGARFDAAEGGVLPVTVHGSRLQGVPFELDVASAQVKSALLLAGLRADGRTTVTEPAASRDHTETMLPLFGVPVGRDEDVHAAWVDGPTALHPARVEVPGDPSSAAFLVGAALMVPGSRVEVPAVELSLARAGFLSVLERMGADVSVTPRPGDGAGSTGDILACYTRGLTATEVSPAEVPSLIDEIPLLAVVAARARGTTRFNGVRELRVKESDRLEALAGTLSAMGVNVRSGDDWLEVDGQAAIRGGAYDSLGDHRLAMAFAVAALVADSPVAIERYDAIAVSFPGFTESLAALAP